LSFAAPLFAVVIGATMLGVVAGAFATWLSQGRHRRASRQNRIEADKWRAQAEALKTARAQETSHPALPGGS
jgi:Flp pilus assembly protein TadB